MVMRIFYMDQKEWDAKAYAHMAVSCMLGWQPYRVLGLWQI
jgi:hypothetical protein